ncbi:serine/threonine-protein kinase [Streptomyces cinerochromogenes]|uniref:serine/threonine-protein kinase n=1 Tax=Streptomyces cinerochromogenes TaxID=66422 RepID=UPI0016711B8D|nr:serine/threonine-protein kinase [Streptomyces cinerochromogenes]GGS73243.1 serine/threonine protein kinase [Streptomyces cinerochromogenes]
MSGRQPGWSDAAAPDGPAHVVAGRYRVLRRLGRGGMGVVHEAEDVRLGRRVAVKMLTAVEGLATQDTAWERFQREIRALARIDHPGVVTLYDSGMHEGVPYLVMQVLDGTSLADLVVATGPLPSPAACTVALGITDALEAAHDKGVFHRDVKPSNVGVTGNGRVVLQDFGLARLAGEAAITRTGALIGTPQFMAPEAMSGGPREAAADWYGLGACLFLMLTGELPFGPTADVGAIIGRALGEGIRPLTADEGIPEPLAELVGRLCRRDPLERLTDAAAVRETLVPLMYGGTEDLSERVTRHLRAQAVDAARGTEVSARALPALQDEQPEYHWDEDVSVPGAAPDPMHPATLSDTTRRIVLGSMTPQGALSRQREAVGLVQRGQIREAAQMLAVVVQVCLSKLGPDHPTTLTSQYWQAVCRARLDAGEEALDMLSRVNRRIGRRAERTDTSDD